MKVITSYIHRVVMDSKRDRDDFINHLRSLPNNWLIELSQFDSVILVTYEDKIEAELHKEYERWMQRKESQQS
ncbi:MAG: hypothetical protein WBD31_32730 [Rubripirellula sp.]